MTVVDLKGTKTNWPNIRKIKSKRATLINMFLMEKPSTIVNRKCILPELENMGVILLKTWKKEREKKRVSDNLETVQSICRPFHTFGKKSQSK